MIFELQVKDVILKLHPEAYAFLCWSTCFVMFVLCHGILGWGWYRLFLLFLALAASGHYLKPQKKSRPRRKYAKHHRRNEVYSDSRLSEGESTKGDHPPDMEEVSSKDWEPLETSTLEIPTESFIREFDRSCFTSPDSTAVKVRGPNYLQDKIKICSAPSLFLFVHNLAFSQVDELVHDTTEFDWCWYRRARPPRESFTLIINFQIVSLRKQIISYFYIKDKESLPDSVKLFLEGNDDYRKNHFKMIPKLTKAPLPIRLATPMAPVIIARKIDVDWIIGGNYMSIVMKPDSSLLAANIIRMAHPASKNLIVDLFFCVEGKQREHLPEQVLCGLRWEKLDLKQFDTCERVKLSGSSRLQWMKRVK